MGHEEEGPMVLVVKEEGEEPWNDPKGVSFFERWPTSELEAFVNFLVMQTKGFELEIMAFFFKKKMDAIKGTKAQGNLKRKKKICFSKFKRERKDWNAKKFRWGEGRLLRLLKGLI